MIDFKMVFKFYLSPPAPLLLLFLFMIREISSGPRSMDGMTDGAHRNQVLVSFIHSHFHNEFEWIQFIRSRAQNQMETNRTIFNRFERRNGLCRILKVVLLFASLFHSCQFKYQRIIGHRRPARLIQEQILTISLSLLKTVKYYDSLHAIETWNLYRIDHFWVENICGAIDRRYMFDNTHIVRVTVSGMRWHRSNNNILMNFNHLDAHTHVVFQVQRFDRIVNPLVNIHNPLVCV